MTSNDKEILIEINGELQIIRREISTLRKDTETLTLRVSQMETQLSDLKGYINTWVPVIAIVIAIASITKKGLG